jgi:tRNA(adenine34) deaminase
MPLDDTDESMMRLAIAASRDAARLGDMPFGAASLRGSTVYASGEPCAMCCGVLFWAGVGRVVYAASTARLGEILGDPRLPIDSRAVLAGASPAVHVDGPLLGDEAAAVLRDFAEGRLGG